MHKYNRQIFFYAAVCIFLVFIAGVAGYASSGYWSQAGGFIAPVWFSLVCHVVCFVYLLSVPKSRAKLTNAPRFLSCNSFKSMWSLTTKLRENGGRKILLLLIVGSGIVLVSIFGIEGVVALYYLASPLCLSSIIIGYMLGFYIFAIGVGALFFTSAPVGRCLGKFKRAVLGTLAGFLSLIWLAFCRYHWMINPKSSIDLISYLMS